MYKNNFDCSSSGINIEVTACYDTDLSRLYYDDMFNTVWFNNRSHIVLDNDLGVGYKGESFKAYEVVDFTVKKKLNVMDLLDEYGDYFYDANEYTKEEALEELKEINGKYVQELIEKGYAKPKEGYKSFVSRGYCQGDYAFVICKDDLSEDYIDHLLWDAPVYASVTIGNATEYLYQDFCKDEYEWDKEGFIRCVCECYTNDNSVRESLKKQLNDMLPEELQYV
jgi:hypothetical protein